MKKLKMKLNAFFRRIYGLDDLNKVLLAVALLLSVLATVLKSLIFELLYFAVFIYMLFRFFSTKKFARSEENRRFRGFIRLWQQKWKQRKTHRVFRCSGCGQLIRVPKGKGRIETSCPHCGKKENHYS